MSALTSRTTYPSKPVNNANTTQNSANQNLDDTSIRQLSFNKREQIIKQIYEEILGKKPTYKEIDKFAYSDITPNQIRLKLIQSEEFKQLKKRATDYFELEKKADLLKNELKQVLWLIKNIQKQLEAKDQLLYIKKQEIRQLREFIKQLSKEYPEGPSSFFCTIYKTEYTQIIDKNSRPSE